MGYAPPYYLRLRIYARQVNYFYRKLRALPPVYDNCPVRCLAPEADRANGCPDCDFTVFYKTFRKNYERIVTKDVRKSLIDQGVKFEDADAYATEEAHKTWSFETIAEDYRSLSELESFAGTETADAPGGYDRDWNIRVRTGIDIIREERYKVRREFSYKAEQEALARAAANRGKR